MGMGVRSAMGWEWDEELDVENECVLTTQYVDMALVCFLQIT